MRAPKFSLIVAALAAVTVGVAPIASAAPTSAGQAAAAPSVSFRSGGHDGFDRVVFEFAGANAPTKFTWKAIDTQRPAWGPSGEPVENLPGKYFLHIAAESPQVTVTGKNPASYSHSNVKGAVVNDMGHGGTIELAVGLARNKSYTVTPEGKKLIIDIKH
ncbi:AMIN-like domain-containing (lipo)protein [Saccharothrix sp. ALI-22-I]|uniref:AMIN-like domain-containing (lipo)protein n=1 Tax=Saccharothrix sp. ALI-22-I TaxID=1933778 RepID=UPI000A034145